MILEPFPPAFIGLLGVTICASFNLVGKTPSDSINWALSGFSNQVIWLIFASFMFALGYKKSGLGKRFSLYIIKILGKTTLGLGYAVAFADGILSPFMPSNTARSGGIIFPIAINIPQIFNSTPENEPRKIGSYISWVSIATSCITSSMFLTALSTNLLALALVEKSAGISISWLDWFSSLAVITIPLFILIPYLTYIIYPPTQKSSPDAPVWASKELKKNGRYFKK